MLKVKAIEKLQKIGKYEGTHRYVMQPEMYAQLAQDKVIKEASWFVFCSDKKINHLFCLSLAYL